VKAGTVWRWVKRWMETAKINDSLPLGMTLTKVTDQSVNIARRSMSL
jgi:hypothetical protein